jgi:hypothetical protein
LVLLGALRLETALKEIVISRLFGNERGHQPTMNPKRLPGRFSGLEAFYGW